MSLSFSPNPRKIFIKIFSPFLAIVVCSIIFVSVIFYMNFKSITKEMLFKESSVTIENISMDVTRMKEIVSAIAIQSYYDNSVFQLMYYDMTSVEVLPLIQRLKSYKSSFPYLISMYAYNGKTFYDSDGFSYPKDMFPDKYVVDVVNHIEMYPKSKLVPRFVDNSLISPNASGTSLVYTYVFYDNYQKMGAIDNALVFNISEKWLTAGMNGANRDNSRILIVDGSGRTINTDSIYPARSDISNQLFVQKVMAAPQGPGYFTETIDDTQMVVTYNTTDIEGWTFISLQPYDRILSKITWIRPQIVAIVFVSMVFGVMMTFYSSRRLFIPVKSMTMDIYALSKEKRSHLYEDKQAVLKNFLMHASPFSTRQSSEYGIQISGSAEGYVLLLLRLDSFKRFCSQYNLADRNLIKYGIINIGNEAMAQYFRGECIDVRDDSVLFLAHALDGQAVNKQNAERLIEDLYKHLKLYLDATQTWTITTHACAAPDLRKAFNELLEASEYRMLEGKGSFMDSENCRFRNVEEFLYPSDKEVFLTEAIMLGKSDQAKAIFSDVSFYAATFGRVIFNSSLSRLLISIHNTLLVIQKNHEIVLDYSFNHCLDCILNMETVQEIVEEFERIFDAAAEEMNQFKMNRHEKLMNDVLDYIALNYASQDLCMNQIAEFVHLTPAYLAKLFKKYKSISISDYIISVRLEKAKSYIMNDTSSITMIMNKTGFTSRSHFYTAFKAAYGATPNEMRKGSGIQTT